MGPDCEIGEVYGEGGDDEDEGDPYEKPEEKGSFPFRWGWIRGMPYSYQ